MDSDGGLNPQPLLINFNNNNDTNNHSKVFKVKIPITMYEKG
jgi:hypothetical protein